MDFAVIKLAGKQFLVSTGDKVVVDAYLGEPTKTLEVAEVLLTNVGDNLEIGTPLVTGAKVVLEVVAQGRGEKIDVFKFKAKSRYRRKVGFRANQTTFKVISFGEVKKVAPSTTKPSISASRPAKKVKS